MPRKAFVLRACLNTSKQIHLNYLRKNNVHYAIFVLLKGHIRSHYTAKTTGII